MREKAKVLTIVRLRVEAHVHRQYKKKPFAIKSQSIRWEKQQGGDTPHAEVIGMGSVGGELNF